MSAVPAFRRNGLATVSGLDDATGQVALVYLLAGARSGSYGLGQDRRGRRPPGTGDGAAAGRGVTDGLTVLVAARDEEARIGDTVAALRTAFPHAEVVVADDGSRDETAAEGGGGRGARRPAAAARQGPGADARRARVRRAGRSSSATPIFAAT